MPDSAKDVAARLTAAMGFRGVGVLELAEKAKVERRYKGKMRRHSVGRNSVGRHLKPKEGARLPGASYLRAYEQALGLPPLTLDSGSPQELLALLQHAPQSAREPYQVPYPAGPDDLDGTFRFIRSQLEGYRMTGRLIAPQVVEAWLAELEAATVTRPAPQLADARSGSASPATGPPRPAASSR